MLQCIFHFFETNECKILNIGFCGKIKIPSERISQALNHECITDHYKKGFLSMYPTKVRDKKCPHSVRINISVLSLHEIRFHSAISSCFKFVTFCKTFW